MLASVLKIPERETIGPVIRILTSSPKIVCSGSISHPYSESTTETMKPPSNKSPYLLVPQAHTIPILPSPSLFHSSPIPPHPEPPLLSLPLFGCLLSFLQCLRALRIASRTLHPPSACLLLTVSLVFSLCWHTLLRYGFVRGKHIFDFGKHLCFTLRGKQ